MATPEYILLFDRDCGICSAFGRWVHAADLRRRIELRTIQSGRDLLRGVPEDRIFDAFHMITPSGGLATGGDAVPVLIEALPMGAGVGRILRGSGALMSAVHSFYQLLTRFRDRLVCRVDARATSAGLARSRRTGGVSTLGGSPHPFQGTPGSRECRGSARRSPGIGRGPFRASLSRCPRGGPRG